MQEVVVCEEHEIGVADQELSQEGLLVCAIGEDAGLARSLFLCQFSHTG